MKIFPTAVYSLYNTDKSLMNRTHNSQDNESTQKRELRNNYNPGVSIPFTHFRLKNEKNKQELYDSHFYRDKSTLLEVEKYMTKKFPEGTDIMIFACSNGEEVISVDSILNLPERNKYNIHAYDIADEPLIAAKNNVYSAVEKIDEFLLKDKSDSKEDSFLKERFNLLMERTSSDNKYLQDDDRIKALKAVSPFLKIFNYKIRDEYVNDFTFEKGDVRNLPDILPEEQVGAVFFRNAFYHMTKNYLFEENVEDVNELYKINRSEIINDVVDKVYDKLLVGGIFVVGEHIKDHCYLADYSLPEREWTNFIDKRFYLSRRSPLSDALRKDGRFEPIYYTNYSCVKGEFIFPTIWKKVV